MDPAVLNTLFWLTPALAGTVVFIALRLLRLRETRGFSVMTSYSPPPGLTPAEAGMLSRGAALACDLTATLMDLDQRGFVNIEATPVTEADPKGDFNFQLLKREPDWRGLKPHETTLLFQIFMTGERNTLAALQSQFAVASATFRREVRNVLLAGDLWRYDPLVDREYGKPAVLIAGVLSYFGAVAGFPMSWKVWFVLAVIGIVLGAVAFLGFEGDIRTAEGRRMYAQVRGFQEFMSRVDAERLKTLPVEILGRNLPYAVALGVSAQWTASLYRLGGIGGTDHAVLNQLLFDSDRFTDEISGMSYDTYSALMHAPHGGPEVLARFIAETEKARHETYDPNENKLW